jgi:pimeloyl-ACP methyl ester carboxylesterase
MAPPSPDPVEPDPATIRERFLATAERRTAVADGQEWETFDTGTGSPTLVALPGAVGGGEAAFYLAEQLRPGIRVVASSIPAVKRMDQAVHGLRECLQARGVERPVLLGASYSGLIIQAYVRAFPAEVGAMILSHTGVLDPSRARSSLNAARVVGFLPLPVTRALLRLLVRALTRNAPHAAFWRETYGRFIDATSKDLLVSRYLLTADLCSGTEWSAGDLRDWPGRILIIDSDDDKVASADTRRRLRALYPEAEVATFKGTGHSTAIARPREYSEVVRDFILGAPRRG